MRKANGATNGPWDPDQTQSRNRFLSFAGHCSERPQNLLVPVAASAPGTSKVEMVVATMRSDRNAEKGELFTGECGLKMAFADIVISIPPDSTRQIGQVQWPSDPAADPSREFASVQAAEIGQKAALARLHAMVGRTGKRRVLLFIHGNDTRFVEAVYRLAQLSHDSMDCAPISPARSQPETMSWTRPTDPEAGAR